MRIVKVWDYHQVSTLKSFQKNKAAIPPRRLIR